MQAERADREGKNPTGLINCQRDRLYKVTAVNVPKINKC